jgi:ATP-dependent RNA helicase DHX57
MGGIRNREEKKKAAKVFSSGGGGGGTKGPSIIEKRNQEQKCPFCERVFKQVREAGMCLVCRWVD